MKGRVLLGIVGFIVVFSYQVSWAHLTGYLAHPYRSTITLHVFDDPDLRPSNVPQGWLYWATFLAVEAWNSSGMGLKLQVVVSQISLCGDFFFDVGWMDKPPLVYRNFIVDRGGVMYNCGFWWLQRPSEQDVYLKNLWWSQQNLSAQDLFRALVATMTHEIGHVLGLYDQYEGAPTNHGHKDNECWSIMINFWHCPGLIYPTWYDKQWALAIYPSDRVTLLQIDIPIKANESVWHWVQIFDTSGSIVWQQGCAYESPSTRISRVLSNPKIPKGAYIAVLRLCSMQVITERGQPATQGPPPVIRKIAKR